MAFLPQPSPKAMTMARDHLLEETVAHIQEALSSLPSGLLIVGTDADALREAVSTAVPKVHFRSCCLYVVGETPPKAADDTTALCLEHVDMTGAGVEGALKGIFSRRQQTETVIGLARLEHRIPPGLLRAGRFEKVMRARAPSFVARTAAWSKILSVLVGDTPASVPHDTAAVELAGISPGYSLRDFAGVMYEFLASYSPPSESEALPLETFAKLRELVAVHKPLAGSSDLDFISSSITSSQNIQGEPNGWGGCGGYQTVKDMLVRLCEWPVRHRETFERLGVDPPRGVLLHGPHGCGKTMLAMAFLKRLKQANWLHVNSPDLFSKYLGDSEARVRALFSRARSLSPCVIFIDELDVVGGDRRSGGDDGGTGVERRVLGSLLTELDGISGGDVFVLACASDLSAIDPALVRPGRLDHLLLVAKPDFEDRKHILSELLRGIPIGTASGASKDDAEGNKSKQIEIIAKDTEGCSGADLQAICREAAMIAMETVEDPELVSDADFAVARERMGKRR